MNSKNTLKMEGFKSERGNDVENGVDRAGKTLLIQSLMKKSMKSYVCVDKLVHLTLDLF